MSKKYPDMSGWVHCFGEPDELEEAFKFIAYDTFGTQEEYPKWFNEFLCDAYGGISQKSLSDCQEEIEPLDSEWKLLQWCRGINNFDYLLNIQLDLDPSNTMKLSFSDLIQLIRKWTLKHIYELVHMDLAHNQEKYEEFLENERRKDE